MRWPWRRNARDAELMEELQAHIEMATQQRIERGESPAAARDNALREFGNATHVAEVTREMWGGASWNAFVLDIRYAMRGLRRSPGFTAVAVATFALGIGVNTAMFAVLNGVLLRPLPFPDPDRLLAVSYTMAPRAGSHGAPTMFDDHYVILEKDTSIFAQVATYGVRTLTVTGAGDPLSVSTARVTPHFFSMLSAHPQLGRAFDESDAAGDDGTAVILSDALWHTRFNANPSVIGTTVTLEGVSRTIVGVMPASFDYPAGTDMWQPWRIVANPKQNIMSLSVIGRLRAGVSIDQAQQMFAAYAPNLPVIDGPPREGMVPQLIPLKTVVVGDIRTPLLIFSGAIGFVLLIACANVANLLLMRIASRDREMALRAALGASRTRLVRQLLTETLALATIGAVAGVGLGWATLRMLLALAPQKLLPRADGIRIDLWTLAFTAGLTILTAIVCGLIPALHASEQHLHASLAAGARTVTGGRQRLRSFLVGSEIALALVLLTGAGLLVRSFERMRSVDLGYDPRNALELTVDLPRSHYASSAEMRDFDARVIANLRSIPGVEAAGAINFLPLTKTSISGSFTLEDGRELPPGYIVGALSVSPDYFRAMGMHIERGRAFTADDRTNGARVVILSHSVAEKLWPGGTAIGKRISSSDKPTAADWVTIVGVVNDVVQGAVTSPTGRSAYSPIAQTDPPFFLRHVTFVLRSSDETALTPIEVAAARVLREADPNLAVETATPIPELIDRTTAAPRFQSRMLLTFSLTALALAMIGVYGVLSYNLAQRQQEIGVRIALGATPGEIARMVLRRTALLVIPGIVVGLGASFALTRLLGRFLFQITATDPATFASVVAVLAVVALAAAALPARRASRTDPTILTRAAG